MVFEPRALGRGVSVFASVAALALTSHAAAKCPKTARCKCNEQAAKSGEIAAQNKELLEASAKMLKCWCAKCVTVMLQTLKLQVYWCKNEIRILRGSEIAEAFVIN